MDHPVPAEGQDDDHAGEDEDSGRVADIGHLPDGLAGEHGAGGVEADVHDADQHQWYHRAEHAELHAAGDHLRQAELRPLCAVQGHDDAAEHLADQQADQGPEHVTAQHDRQGAGHYRGDLQVGAEP
ncbi:hypothetical protein D3C84_443780 [compost metagenome]